MARSQSSESTVVQLYDKLIAALNPFFRHYSSHRLVGFLVFVCIIGGVAVLAVINSQCVDTKSTDLRVEEKYGNYMQQKAFIETLKSDLEDSQAQDVKRVVDICTFGAWASVPEAGVPVYNDGINVYKNPNQPVAEMTTRPCIYPRSKDIERMEWPDGFKWCKEDELAEPVRRTYYTGSTIFTDGLQKKKECSEDMCRASDGAGGFHCWTAGRDPVLCADGRQPLYSTKVSVDIGKVPLWIYRKYTCCRSQWGQESTQKLGEHESVAPEEAMAAYYDLMYPGWRCILDNTFDDQKCKGCNWTPHPEWHGTYVNDCTAYLYCGHSINRHDPLKKLRWDSYDQSPWGTLVSYTHGYQIRTTTYSCPKKDFGTVIGSALAYVAYIELLATLVIGGLFIALGISKPNTKQASFMNLLRGAGISEIDKNQDQVDELEKKVNALMAQSEFSNASAPAAAQEVGVMMPSVQPPPQPQLVQPPLQQPLQQPVVTVSNQQPLQQPVVTVSNPVEPPQQLAQAAFCTGCGAPLKPGAKFCTTCGKSGP